MNRCEQAADGFTPVSDIGPDYIYTHYVDHACHCEHRSAQECSTCIPSDATESDRTGIGRSLGRLYIRLGWILERFLNRTADRLGYGPYAIERWLKARFDDQRRKHRVDCTQKDDDGDLPGSRTSRGVKVHATRPSPISPSTSGDSPLTATSKRDAGVDSKAFDKKLKKLVSYTHSDVHSTQVKALQVLNDFIKSKPATQTTLRNQQAHVSLASLIVQLERRARHHEDVNALLHASRTALVCVEESELNTAGQEFIHLQESISNCVHTSMCTQKDHKLLSLLSTVVHYLSNPHFAFLAARYLSFCDFQQLQLGALHRPNKTIFLSSPHLRTTAEATRLATGKALLRLLLSRNVLNSVELDTMDRVLREMFWWLLLQDTHADDAALNLCMVELAIAQELLGLMALPIPILPIVVWNLLASDPSLPLQFNSQPKHNTGCSASSSLPSDVRAECSEATLELVSACEIDQRYFDGAGMTIKRAKSPCKSQRSSFDDIVVDWTIKPGCFPYRRTGKNQRNLRLSFSISASSVLLDTLSLDLNARVKFKGQKHAMQRTITLSELSAHVDYHSELCRTLREGGMRSMTHYWLWNREPGLRPQPIQR